MKLFLSTLLMSVAMCATAQIKVSEHSGRHSLSLTEARIYVSPADAEVVKRSARMLADDVMAVSGCRPQVQVSDNPKSRLAVIAGTIGHSPIIGKMIERGVLDVSEISGGWEQYISKVVYNPAKGVERALVIAGTDRRGVAYGLLAVSKAIGVSPWAWWADVPVAHHDSIYIEADYASRRPAVKYRGIFINDEDWGLKPWAATNYEKNLGDIGPRTYAKVCELLLRLGGNMLAPAMHSCTGAFYSHKESKLVADTFGIVITTSHCEPLLLNNAAESEWNPKVDGDWNYKTNSTTILRKWNDRLKEASRFENIYTTAMRGVHDSGLTGNLPMQERVPLIEQVIADQRDLLKKYTGHEAEDVPQIFVPYKETMDIYENGLSVPDDVTLVWVDDNYGYMKRVSSPAEQRRSGGSGVYYHLSYLGAPHDYLWIQTTPPVLMYEELKKAFDTGADRYWLLNVGDIKPMELGIQTFFDMAWDLAGFDFATVNTHQARFLAGVFGAKYERDFQHLLDEYYRLAWSRKPEFMGWEREWDDPRHTGLKDTDYSFDNYNEAQQRLADYRELSDHVNDIAADLPADLQPAFFELMEYQVKGAYQMNRKFLMAQLNHELARQGKEAQANWAANEAKVANDSIWTLTREYNQMIDGKWNGMMDLAPAYNALYYQMPEVTTYADATSKAVDIAPHRWREWHEGCYVVRLDEYAGKTDTQNNHIQIVRGIGYDWQVVQMGRPEESDADPQSMQSANIEYKLPAIDAESVEVIVYTVPFWPIYKGRGTQIGIKIDECEPKVYNNIVREYSIEWKDQVLQNGDVARFRFDIDGSRSEHVLRLICGNPGMMVQKVIIDWGGLKKSYIGPSR